MIFIFQKNLYDARERKKTLTTRDLMIDKTILQVTI